MSSEDDPARADDTDPTGEGAGTDEGNRDERQSDSGSATRRADQVACTEQVLEATPEAAIVSNLGVASYVLAGVRDRPRNFYCWGSMGLTTSIGLGLALAIDEQVTVFEGDGSLLMSLGVLSTVAACDPSNFVVIVWDNGVYGTTGGQRVTEIDVAGAARACGVEATTAETTAEFEERYVEAVAHEGPALVVCRVEPTDPDARPPLDFARVSRRFRGAVAGGVEVGGVDDSADAADEGECH